MPTRKHRGKSRCDRTGSRYFSPNHHRSQLNHPYPFLFSFLPNLPTTKYHLPVSFSSLLFMHVGEIFCLQSLNGNLPECNVFATIEKSAFRRTGLGRWTSLGWIKSLSCRGYEKNIALLFLFAIRGSLTKTATQWSKVDLCVSIARATSRRTVSRRTMDTSPLPTSYTMTHRPIYFYSNPLNHFQIVVKPFPRYFYIFEQSLSISR